MTDVLLFFLQVKAGAILNILCTLVVTLATHTWGMAIFDLSNSPFVTVNNGTINATTVMSAVLYWSYLTVSSSLHNSLSKLRLYPYIVNNNHCVQRICRKFCTDLFIRNIEWKQRKLSYEFIVENALYMPFTRKLKRCALTTYLNNWLQMFCKRLFRTMNENTVTS